jgi:hypothetical protein
LIPRGSLLGVKRGAEGTGELGLDPNREEERWKETRRGSNERASGEFMLRMGAQASRVMIIPPVSEIRGIKDEIFELPALQDLILEIEGTVGRYFKPGSNSAYESVHDVSMRCIKSASKIYGEEAARKGAEGFKWDPVKLASDQAAFEAADFSITTMALTRQDSLRSQRLNLTRLLSLSIENPEMEHLRSLCKGIIVPKPEGYRPNAKCFRELKEVLFIQKYFCHWSNCTPRSEPLKIPVREVLTYPAANHYIGLTEILGRQLIRCLVTCMIKDWDSTCQRPYCFKRTQYI